MASVQRLFCWYGFTRPSFHSGTFKHRLAIWGLSSRRWVTYDRSDPKLKFMTLSCHRATYDVGYLCEGPPDGPTLLAIHGTPGAASNFDVVTQKLVDVGIRVVAPNLPGNNVTNLSQNSGRGDYNYSAKHRSEYMTRFLEAMDINRVDVVMGHSLGGPVALEFAANTEAVKGLVLINTIGYEPHRHIRPYWRTKYLSKGLFVPGLRQLMKMALLTVYRRRGIVDFGPDDLMTGAMTAGSLDFARNKLNAENVCSRGLPVLSVHCQNDVVVDWDRGYDLGVLAGGHKEEAKSWFDRQENCYKGPPIDEVIPSRTLVFDTGGHNAHRTHSEYLFKALRDLMDHVTRL